MLDMAWARCPEAAEVSAQGIDEPVTGYLSVTLSESLACGRVAGSGGGICSTAEPKIIRSVSWIAGMGARCPAAPEVSTYAQAFLMDGSC
jgi:hypothetical protein